MYIEISNLDNQFQLNEQQQKTIVGGEAKRLGYCAKRNDGKGHICLPDANNTPGVTFSMNSIYTIPAENTVGLPEKFSYYSDGSIEAS